MSQLFRALVVRKQGDEVTKEIEQLTVQDLPESDVLIKVAYSSVNYKDGLASIPKGKIIKSYPFVPGIDLAGTVVKSKDSRYQEGDEVIVTSYELGVSHYGGYSEYACVPSGWIVPLPAGLTLREAMILGTAGFTAALSVQRLEDNGVTTDKGPVLVMGASGGVGSVAVAMLAKLGYHVVASTGKQNEHEYLKEIGAKEVISREEVMAESSPAIGRQRWAAVVDPVGGEPLAAVLSNLKYRGSVASSGLTAGTKVPTTVFPFILRGVNLLGIDSVYCPMEVRQPLWERMGADMKPDQLLETIAAEVDLEQLPDALSSILEGKVKGRIIVKL